MPPSIPKAHKAPFVPREIEAKSADGMHMQPAEAPVSGRIRPLPGGLLVLHRQHTVLAVFLPAPELRRLALQCLQIAEQADAREAEGARAAAVAGGEQPADEPMVSP